MKLTPQDIAFYRILKEWQRIQARKKEQKCQCAYPIIRGHEREYCVSCEKELPDTTDQMV